jgi:hypothetical protein
VAARLGGGSSNVGDLMAADSGFDVSQHEKDGDFNDWYYNTRQLDSVATVLRNNTALTLNGGGLGIRHLTAREGQRATTVS